MSKLLLALAPPQERWLRGEAERLGISVSELLRRALDEYRERRPTVIVKAHRSVCTKGQYQGEKGTGYGWGELEEYGDFSNATRGHYQGYTEPCEIEVYKGTIRESQLGELLLYVAPDQPGLTVDEALGMGYARVVTPPAEPLPRRGTGQAGGTEGSEELLLPVIAGSEFAHENQGVEVVDNLSRVRYH